MNRGFYSFKAKDADMWIDAMWESHLPGVVWGQEVVPDPGWTRRMSTRETLHVVCCCCCTTVLCTCRAPSKGDLRRTGQRARVAGNGAHSNGLPQPCQLCSPARAHTTYSPTLSHCQPTRPPLLPSCWGEAGGTTDPEWFGLSGSNQVPGQLPLAAAAAPKTTASTAAAGYSCLLLLMCQRHVVTEKILLPQLCVTAKCRKQPGLLQQHQKPAHLFSSCASAWL